MVKFVAIHPSHKTEKKYDAVFETLGGRIRIVPFGAKGYTDFTISKDVEKQKAYHARHKNDKLDDPMSPGALSWYILWSAPTIREGILNYKKRFGFR